jgi:DNA-binding NtrC family response regulator
LFSSPAVGDAIAFAKGVILLVWASEKAKGYARAIEGELRESVRVVSNLDLACEQLRANEFSAVVLDQWEVDLESPAAAVVFEHLGPAIPVSVNFGLSGIERIIRELRAAFVRRRLESRLAHETVRQALRDELKEDATALLLCCGLALEQPELGELARTRLEEINERARRISSKLAGAVAESNAAKAGT